MMQKYNDRPKVPPTEKQYHYAQFISRALDDNANLGAMDKWEMRDYISNSLADPEKRSKIQEYRYELRKLYQERMEVARRRRERTRRYPTDDFLNANYGLDPSDFGIFPWGDS